MTAISEFMAAVFLLILLVNDHTCMLSINLIFLWPYMHIMSTSKKKVELLPFSIFNIVNHKCMSMLLAKNFPQYGRSQSAFVSIRY